MIKEKTTPPRAVRRDEVRRLKQVTGKKIPSNEFWKGIQMLAPMKRKTKGGASSTE